MDTPRVQALDVVGTMHKRMELVVIDKIASYPAKK